MAFDKTLVEGFMLAAECSSYKDMVSFLKLLIADQKNAQRRTDDEFRRDFWRGVRHAAKPEVRRAWQQYLKEQRMESPIVELVWDDEGQTN